MSDITAPCPCGSGQQFTHCCARYLNGEQVAPTAEALMRSRYTAYVRSDEQYLLKTWHASTRPVKLSLADSQPDKWLGLKIISTDKGLAQHADGIVEFVARYKVNGKAGRIHEVSEFVCENGMWFYIKGNLIE